jgi:UDP-N-acetylglucosamine 2-epimerase (non-hydrolysing)
MKIMTILGTRPEIIRLSGVIRILDKYATKHWLVHTGQNFDDRLSGLFFSELEVRLPDFHMGIRAASFAEQIGQILVKAEALFLEHRPDRLLILGDTNSGLAAIVAKRLGIPVYHMEAGNRCYDDRVPEEVNRRIIDHSSTILMPYTERSRDNLLREGIASDRIFVTGNPIREVMEHYRSRISSSTILTDLGLEPHKYFLLTAHRSENVDIEPRLRTLVHALVQISRKYGYPVIGSLHPRTASKIQRFGIAIETESIRLLPPLGFFDFVHLEEHAFCTLSDSGTVQEETCILGVPNVTIRDVTERPETLECGSNLLSGIDDSGIERAVDYVTNNRDRWAAPPEYLRTGVAATVGRIVLGHRQPDESELLWRSASR